MNRILSVVLIATALQLVLYPSMLRAQTETVHGHVVDMQTKQAIIAATVYIDSAGTITNAEGRFETKAKAGKVLVRIEYEGYEKFERKFTVVAGDTNLISIRLNPRTQEMGPIVITGSQDEKRIVEEIVAIEILPADLLANNNATELGEAVDKSIGVQVQDGQISIRGGSSWSYGVGSRTSILVDNLLMQAGDLQTAELKFVPMEIVDRVEIVKGASSVIYGSSALNGVVNVLTKWPGDTAQTEINFFQGVYDTPPGLLKWWDDTQILGSTGMSGYHSRKHKNLDLVFAGNIFRRQSYLQFNDENRLRMLFKTRYNHPNKPGMKFGLNGSLMAERSGRFFLMRGDETFNPNDTNDVDSSQYYLYWWGDGSNDKYIRTQIDPHFSYLTENGTRHRVLMRILNIFREGGHLPDASTTSINVDYLFQKHLTDRITLTAGAPAYLTRSESNLYPGVRISAAGAGYGQIEYKYDRLTALGGVRYEFTHMLSGVGLPDTIADSCGALTSGLPVFRFGTNYRLGKATFLRASWGQAFRQPSVGERCLDSEATLLQVAPNGDLQPERSWNLELGVKQAIKISKFVGYADLSFFWSEYRNLIEYRPFIANVSPITLGFRPDNIQDARVAGFEVSLAGEGKIGQSKLRILTGYTYNYPADLTNHPEQKNIGTYMDSFIFGLTNRFTDSPIPDNIFTDTTSAPMLFRRTRHLVKADAELFYRKVSIGGAFFYSSFPEMIDGVMYLAVRALQDYAEAHKRGDHAIQLRAGWQINDMLKATFIVKNVANRVYASRPGIIEAPRNYLLQFRFRF